MLERKDIARINREMLAKDESHLWPICNKFNVTKRAIGRVSRAMRDGLYAESPYEYEAVLDNEISNIVNDERNW